MLGQAALRELIAGLGRHEQHRRIKAMHGR